MADESFTWRGLIRKILFDPSWSSARKITLFDFIGALASVLLVHVLTNGLIEVFAVLAVITFCVTFASALVERDARENPRKGSPGYRDEEY